MGDADYTKDRTERLDYAHDFSKRLNSGETISSIEALEVRIYNASTDVSGEFGTPASTAIVSGTEVLFELDEASSASDQQHRWYNVYICVLTSDNDRKTAARNSEGDYPTLRVHQQ